MGLILRPQKGVAVTDFIKIRFPCYGAPKIDGFRFMLANQPLTSRLGPFPNEYFRKSLSGIFPDDWPLLDGEVVVGKRSGKGVLGRTSSGLTSVQGEPNFNLWCFDTPQVGYSKRDRLQLTQQIVKDLRNPRIRFLRHVWLENVEQLEAYLDQCLELGFEGIMTYAPEAHYKFGKATLREQNVLKIKPFETAEGKIKGWFEEQENTNEAKRELTGKLKRSSAKAGKVGKGRLGGFILDDCKTGDEVRVGGGFTKEQRIELWKIKETLRGELVTYKRQTVGAKDKPRHPGFVDFVTLRPTWDMSD